MLYTILGERISQKLHLAMYKVEHSYQRRYEKAIKYAETLVVLVQEVMRDIRVYSIKSLKFDQNLQFKESTLLTKWIEMSRAINNQRPIISKCG